MLKDSYSHRTIINRSYYVMFYSVLALFLYKELNIDTSKHAGVISIFNREFIHKRIFDKKYSKMIHHMFDLRQEYDYREFVESTIEDVKEAVNNAEVFFNLISSYIKNESQKK